MGIIIVITTHYDSHYHHIFWHYQQLPPVYLVNCSHISQFRHKNFCFFLFLFTACHLGSFGLITQIHQLQAVYTLSVKFSILSKCCWTILSLENMTCILASSLKWAQVKHNSMSFQLWWMTHFIGLPQIANKKSVALVASNSEELHHSYSNMATLRPLSCIQWMRFLCPLAVTLD